MSAVTYRDLTTLEEFALVVDLERQIWGPVYDDVVPVSILAVSVHSGGILVGAFESDPDRIFTSGFSFGRLPPPHARPARLSDRSHADGPLLGPG